jgi:hypothetical protein
LEKLCVYFSRDDLEVIAKVSSARGQRSEDLVRHATLKLLAELGVLGEERKRFLVVLGH